MSPEFQQLLITIIGGALALAIRELLDRPRRQQLKTDLASANKKAETATTAAASTVQAHAASLEARLAETFTAQLQDTERALTAKVEELSLENTELNRRLDSVTLELAHERAENRDLRADIESKANERALMRKEIDALTEAVENIKRERDTTFDALKLATGNEHALQVRIEALERELGELKIKNIELAAELRAYKLIIDPFFREIVGALRPPTPPAEPMPLEPAA